MMEVQQRLACLSPTQRLSTHPPVSSLRQIPSSPLSLSLTTPDPPSAMIIEGSLRSSSTAPPDSPQQGEMVPTSVSEINKTNFSVPNESHSENSFSHDFQKEATETHSLWGQGSEMTSGVEEFAQGGMAREGAEESTSSGQHSPGQEDLSSSEATEQVHGLDNCYTPPMHATPSTPGSQEYGDRRNRRKQTIEDIVRRIATSEPEDVYPCEDTYQSEEIEEELEPEMEMSRGHMTGDEVDGTPLEISRQILNAQACAESAIKQSLQRDFDAREEMVPDEEEADCYPPENFLHLRKEAEDHKLDQAQRWDEPKLPPPPPERLGGEEKKPGVTVLPKTSLPPYTPPGMGGLHSSLPMSNISETACSPHHFSTPKMNNGWFPGTMPHLFPFSPGMMDSPLGPKFLPFEGKMMEVDKDYLKCNYCERTFRRQKNLENHVESTHHGKGGERPKRETGDMYFKCTHCPYTTKHQSNLYVHLRIHTGERPYLCGACGVQYSQSHSLKSHIVNKHDGNMIYYIKEKRNRSPRGLGYMSTHISPGDHTIFKIPPPPVLPNMQHSNMELVARAIEMAKNSLADGQGPPPPLMHAQHPPSSMPQHSPLMSPNGPISAGHHGLFPKPGFPFNGHFPPGLPFPDMPGTPSSALLPQPSPNGLSSLSPSGNHSNGAGGRSELLNLSMSGLGTPSSMHTPTSSSAPGFSASNHPSLLSPHAKPQQSMAQLPTNTAANTNSSKASEGGVDCAPMDLSTRGGWQDMSKGSGCGGKKDCPPCINCSHGNKLKLLRLNVVRMLSILVPNLNFEEKGISADSDSVDELLQDVIESNTHDDDMVH